MKAQIADFLSCRVNEKSKYEHMQILIIENAVYSNCIELVVKRQLDNVINWCFYIVWNKTVI